MPGTRCGQRSISANVPAAVGIAIFCRVFGEAHGRFVSELRGFRLEEEWLSFYIKPADGLRPPAIMQWVKQTFSVRFNLSGGDPDTSGEAGTGRRCWKRSRRKRPARWIERRRGWRLRRECCLPGTPPDGVSPLTAENPAETGFLPQIPAQTRSRSARNCRHNGLAQRRQTTASPHRRLCPAPQQQP
jgi:hypothetical protein